jgi:hypothetical protein
MDSFFRQISVAAVSSMLRPLLTSVGVSAHTPFDASREAIPLELMNVDPAHR